MQTTVGIIGAMNVEVNILKELAAEKEEIKNGALTFIKGKINGVNVVIVRSGIGKVNAALCTQALIKEFGVTAIINTGIAGAVAEGLKVLDFVVSTDALYHDMDATGFGYKITEIPQMECSDFPADKKLVAAVKEAFAVSEKAEGHSLVEGRIASGDQFISDRELKERIKTNCSPACVEMEGAAIAHAAYLNNVPFVIIRCMSDMADEAGEQTYSFNEDAAASLSAEIVMETLKLLA